MLRDKNYLLISICVCVAMIKYLGASLYGFWQILSQSKGNILQTGNEGGIQGVRPFQPLARGF